MTVLLEKGSLRARIAQTDAEIQTALTLRALSFRGTPTADDSDAFDTRCQHVLIETADDATLLCTYRVLLQTGPQMPLSYAGQYYDLTKLSSFPGTVLEVGRFCIHPGASQNPDILRIAWGAMTQIVDREAATLLFGCSSFHGTDPRLYRDSFALLHRKYRAPLDWSPAPKAPETLTLDTMNGQKPSKKDAMRHMPPLLKTYLLMKGWVSDHAVIDREMNTIHVFTGVEIANIPSKRKKLLRALSL